MLPRKILTSETVSETILYTSKKLLSHSAICISIIHGNFRGGEGGGGEGGVVSEGREKLL